ncbi:MAG: hypothetical protein JF590_02610 [Gemmatimonadetes bacterium]|nr:hypothetical protein [Gemmatimonadota bacterium]
MSHVTRRAPALILVLAALMVPRLAAQGSSPVAWEWGFHGTLLMNGFYNDAPVSTSDDPAFAMPAEPPGSLPGKSLGAAIRQTRLTGTADLAGFAGGALHSELDVDFFGGQVVNARSGPVLRVRRLFGQVQWSRWNLLVGQEVPLVAEVNPVSLAALGVPNFAGAGNLWLWIPQVRVGYDLNGGTGVRFGVDGAALASTTPEGQATGLTSPNSGERSGRPMFEGRLRARWGESGEIGIGGHVGWLATAGDSLLTADGVMASAIIPLGKAFELRGELFDGKGLAVLGGGGAGQNLNALGEPLETKGGWAQLNYRAGAHWELGGGYGFDDPNGAPADEGSAAFKDKSTQYSGRIQWRLAPAVVALEYRHLATTYGGTVGERTATHLNLAMGVEF